MVTPLKKHPGHGGLVAVVLLAAAAVVVITNRPHARHGEQAPPARPAATARMIEPARATAVVADQEFRPRITATGIATYDEMHTWRISAPVNGWLRKTRAKSLGRVVRQGETLGVLYSADVYLATLQLIDQVRTFRNQEDLDARRTQLLRWGMPWPLLQRVEATKRARATLPIVARLGGTIVVEQGKPAELVDADRDLFTISDPTSVWVIFDLPEQDAAHVRVGMPVTLHIGTTTRAAQVSYVYRRVEEGMRSVRVDLRTTKPIAAKTAVTAELQLEKARWPVMPASAVRREGERTFVDVVRNGAVEAREVKLDGTRVQAGVATGEVVQVSAR